LALACAAAIVREDLMEALSAITITTELSEWLETIAACDGLSATVLAARILRASLTSRATRLFQISSTAALIQGVLQGTLSSARLLENGDFGLGTFENLDGEMIVLDGEVFQMHADGIIKRRVDEFAVPFAQVCQFTPTQTCSFPQVENLGGLETVCTRLRTSENLLYAFRIEGRFDVMHARTVRRGPEGASLESAGAEEVKFTWNNVNGCLVYFWSATFTSSFNVPEFHFHFISDDRTRGGHVLDCSFRTAEARVQLYHGALPPPSSVRKRKFYRFQATEVFYFRRMSWRRPFV
jgi:acetolactate decarboxylase